ncbi:class A beta-lactamase [Phenylobacterium sp. LH3H17]|uniref:class A beta-lactamase n=1 Tax=Phenylobacterium sp. LH3H17 TaxID=2903901 RepID=UPI0020C967FE|nr:class A beta-lactamase [Phenylobacterium sp. LH3H17]UTP38287.1 class A beta-lactamase [Phenylobacterium sp. LH3H17]
MGFRTLALAACIGLAVCVAGPGALAAEATTRPSKEGKAVRQEAVLTELNRLAALADGVMGVSIVHIETGRHMSIRGDERFPMASTFKIALAGALLAKVDKGELSLEQMTLVAPDKVVPGGLLAANFPHPGLSMSLANLIELMLVHSDNTATDVLTELAGGPGAVTAWLRTQDIEDQRVDRDTLGHMRGFFGLGPGPYKQAIADLSRRNPNFWELAIHPNPAYDDDVRDTSTPDAMALLLTRIATGLALSAPSTELLLDIMGRCKTGPMRIPGLLPKDVRVAYKTGTMGGSVNAVGIVTLPNGRGRLVIAAYIKKSDQPREARERAIAEVSRLAYDYFVSTP